MLPTTKHALYNAKGLAGTQLLGSSITPCTKGIIQLISSLTLGSVKMNCVSTSHFDFNVRAGVLLLLLLRVPGLAYGKPTRDCRRAISPALEKSPPPPPWSALQIGGRGAGLSF
eukprot:sb/3476835/